jgi:surfactin synthase thioesterase subunit
MPGSEWFAVPARVRDPRIRLFCFPFAGGGASTYYPWARPLSGQGIEVCAVQPPGRGTRLAEAAFTELAPLVDAIGRAMEPLLDRPFAFFGHSFGALVAFAVARWLRDRRLPLPAPLVVSGARAPDVPEKEPPLHGIMPDAAFADAVDTRFRAIPPEVMADEELLALVIPALRADLTIDESYVYAAGPPLPIDIVAYGGADDWFVPEPSLVRWRTQTTTHFDHRMFGGGHFFLNERSAEVLADVTARLAAIRT